MTRKDGNKLKYIKLYISGTGLQKIKEFRNSIFLSKISNNAYVPPKKDFEKR